MMGFPAVYKTQAQIVLAHKPGGKINDDCFRPTQ